MIIIVACRLADERQLRSGAIHVRSRARRSRRDDCGRAGVVYLSVATRNSGCLSAGETRQPSCETEPSLNAVCRRKESAQVTGTGKARPGRPRLGAGPAHERQAHLPFLTMTIRVQRDGQRAELRAATTATAANETCQPSQTTRNHSQRRRRGRRLFRSRRFHLRACRQTNHLASTTTCARLGDSFHLQFDE